MVFKLINMVQNDFINSIVRQSLLFVIASFADLGRYASCKFLEHKGQVMYSLQFFSIGILSIINIVIGTLRITIEK